MVNPSSSWTGSRGSLSDRYYLDIHYYHYRVGYVIFFLFGGVFFLLPGIFPGCQMQKDAALCRDVSGTVTITEIFLKEQHQKLTTRF